MIFLKYILSFLKTDFFSMKRLIAFVFVISNLQSFSEKDNLKLAEQAYDKKKYKEAITQYEELVKDGYKSYQLNFNLGNAYYRNNELGKAIYQYELARKLNPDDEDVRINLGIANAKTVDKINAKENFFVTVVKSNVLSTFSTNAWAWLSVLTLLLAASLAFLFFITSHPVLKRVCFVTGFLLLLGVFATYGLGYSALHAKHQNNYAIVLIKEIKIMNEPNLNAVSKFSLHEGTKVNIIENNGDWLLIKIDNGNEGWVKSLNLGVI
jgi:tetratricopeptide (TPR) repeat protein